MVLVGVGLSVVCFNFGRGAPLGFIDPSIRYLLNGMWFAGTGSLIALTPFGRLSGAHLNPTVSGAFFLLRKLHITDLIGYITSQMLGALVGALLLLLLWGGVARSVQVGSTAPGPGVPPLSAVLLEAGISVVEVLVVLAFTSARPTARFTPLALWILNTVLVWQFAALTGTSLNPARSFGPAVVASRLDVLWIYVVGPAAGMLLAVVAFRITSHDVMTTKLLHDERYRSTGASRLPVRRPGSDHC